MHLFQCQLWVFYRQSLQSRASCVHAPYPYPSSRHSKPQTSKNVELTEIKKVHLKIKNE